MRSGRGHGLGQTSPMAPPDDPSPWPARLAAQLLTRPEATDAASVVRRLLAVQAQDARAMRLAIRSRTTGLTATDVDRALTDDRSLIVSWLNRGTLHLVDAEDYWWLHQLTAPRSTTWNATRLRQEGVSEEDAERGVALVADAVASAPRRRVELRALLDDAGVPTAGQALVHIVIDTCLRGLALRGPVVDGEIALVSPTDWLGPSPSPLDRDHALARLAARYLVAHAPATAEDLAKWAGITLTDARTGLSLAGDEPTATADPIDLPAPRLLGGFDPILHGWVDRTGITGEHRSIVTTNGLFRPIALVEGRAVATWALADGRLTIAPLEAIDDRHSEALLADADSVLAYLGVAASPAMIG